MIAHLNEAGTPAMVWYVRRAVPASYTGPTWDASQNAVAVESLEIAHEGLELIPGVDFAIDIAASVLGG
jgi:phage tail-like protein